MSKKLKSIGLFDSINYDNSDELTKVEIPLSKMIDLSIYDKTEHIYLCGNKELHNEFCCRKMTIVLYKEKFSKKQLKNFLRMEVSYVYFFYEDGSVETYNFEGEIYKKDVEGYYDDNDSYLWITLTSPYWVSNLVNQSHLY